MRKYLTIAFVLSSILLVGVSRSADPGPAGEPGPERPPVTLISRQPPSPMMQEIEDVLASDKAAILALNEELEAAPDEQAALRILQAISQRKQETEIAILRIQEHHLRENGDTASADRINGEIERILNPPRRTPDPEALAASRARQPGGSGHE